MSPPGETAFETSGYTGTPVRWWRTARQLADEASAVADIVLPHVEHVVNFAPTTHLFGHLFGEVLPAERGVTVQQAWRDGGGALPPLPDGRRTLVVCLPATWTRIARSPGWLRGRTAAALHGSAPPVLDTHRALTRLRGSGGFAATEVFGSTETGAVATRPIPDDPDTAVPWTALPDVELVDTAGPDGGAEQPLEVRGPRLARRDGTPAPPPSFRTGDVVRRRDDRRFFHVGRSSRMVKSNGSRVHLDVVESALRTAVPDADVACVPVPDPLRGEHYELYVALPDGTADDGALDETLAGLDVAPSRSGVHQVSRIPRTPTGKIQFSALRALVDAGAVHEEAR